MQQETKSAKSVHYWQGTPNRSYGFGVYFIDECSWKDLPGIYIGEAESLREKLTTNYVNEYRGCGATHVHAHLYGDPVKRCEEVIELVNKHHPPYNRTP